MGRIHDGFCGGGFRCAVGVGFEIRWVDGERDEVRGMVVREGQQCTGCHDNWPLVQM